MSFIAVRSWLHTVRSAGYASSSDILSNSSSPYAFLALLVHGRLLGGLRGGLMARLILNASMILEASQVGDEYDSCL